MLQIIYHKPLHDEVIVDVLVGVCGDLLLLGTKSLLIERMVRVEVGPGGLVILQGYACAIRYL